MPEMEKGRPPENKRSRKPAHPVKREINQEMKVRDALAGDGLGGFDVLRGSTEVFRARRLWRSTRVAHKSLLRCSALNLNDLSVAVLFFYFANGMKITSQ